MALLNIFGENINHDELMTVENEFDAVPAGTASSIENARALAVAQLFATSGQFYGSKCLALSDLIQIIRVVITQRVPRCSDSISVISFQILRHVSIYF